MNECNAIYSNASPTFEIPIGVALAKYGMETDNERNHLMLRLLLEKIFYEIRQIKLTTKKQHFLQTETV